MHRYINIFILLFFIVNLPAQSEDTKYILHDRCINLLYKPAVSYFSQTDISVYRDSRGIIIRFELKDPYLEYNGISAETQKRIEQVGKFLAKIKNAAIIEVHTAKISNGPNKLKNWEVSAVIAGNIENALRNEINTAGNQVHSVGYGEFLPENNTPNNGGKLLNRVDIIILCNVNGE